MKKKILSLILILSLIFGGCAGWAESAPAGLDLDELFSKRDRKADYDADNAVTVVLAGNTASCESDAVSVEGGTVTITEEGVYVLSGELNGMVVVNADKKAKVQLVLDGVSITSETSAALYVIQADKVFLTLAEGSENTLANGGEFIAVDENDIDAAIFSKEDLTLNGAGSLSVLSPAGHGIVSKDDLIVTGGAYAVEAAGHGLSGKDSVRILAGSFAITAGKDGIHSENSDDAEKGFVAIAGGEFTIAAEGDGISASGTLQIDGGDFTLVTGGGSANGEAHAGGWDGFGGFGAPGARGGQRGRGGFGGQTSDGQPPAMPDGQMSDSASSGSDVSRKALKADGNLTLNGGRFSIDAADDAIHCGGDLTVSGGSFDIATGGDGLHADANLIVNDCAMTITDSYEGLEGQTITVNGGDITLTASDDGLNAAGGNDGSGFGGRDDLFGGNSDCSLVINGGALTIDAQGDGLDSNGALTVNGGTVYVSGPTNNGNGALDCGTSAVINGGTVIAAGASGMAVTFGGDSSQGSIMVNVGSQQAGATVTLTDESGRTLASWTPEKSYQNVVVSCEGMVKGGVYTLTAGSYSQQITLDTISYGASSGMGGWGGRRW